MFRIRSRDIEPKNCGKRRVVHSPHERLSEIPVLVSQFRSDDSKRAMVLAWGTKFS